MPGQVDLGNLYRHKVRLDAMARARANVFGMSNSDRVTSPDDNARGRDTRGLILRIVVVAFLAVLFWQAIIAAGSP